MAYILKNVDKKDNCTIFKISDELWNKIKIILPKEKPPKTVGLPIVPFRKVLDGVLYVLGIGCQFEDVAKRLWFWSHTHVIKDFKSGLVKEYLRNYGLDY